VLPVDATASARGRAGVPAGGRGASAGFGTRALRLALLGLLVVFGLLPPLALAVTTNTLVRANLADRSRQGLLYQAQSHANALFALLSLQQDEVTALQNLTTQDTGVPAELINQSLAGAVAETRTALGTQLVELASYSTGQVTAASVRAAIGTSVSTLPVFHEASLGHISTSDIYYDPASGKGWYYIATPIRSADQTAIVSVAIARFSLAPVWSLVADIAPPASCADDGNFLLLVERTDGILLADSCQSHGVFATSASLGPGGLNDLWVQGRYPNELTPPRMALPQVAANVRASAAEPMAAAVEPPRYFTGSAGAQRPLSQYWLIPVANVPWDLLEAQSLPAATAIADQLTRTDLFLSVAITALTALLSLLLGQSIILPIRRLRTRFREVAHRLVAVTRRQDEAAQHQEAVLPPIEATAQLLYLETEEVAQMLFDPRAALPPPVQPGSPTSGAGWGAPADGSPRLFADYLEPAAAAGGRWPGDLPSSGAFLPIPGLVEAVPSLEALRRARMLANDWSLRQQRILADLAGALNATDELSRASLDGHLEATQLANLAAGLLVGTR
jgi:hypothetical protein